MAEKPTHFWSSLPGILTGIAALITALTGAYVAFQSTRPPAAAGSSIETVKIEPDSSASAENPAPSSEPSPRPTPASPVDSGPAVAMNEAPRNIDPFPGTGPLVDCNQFPTVNTVGSLMSWSNHYHQQVVAAEGVHGRALHACNQAIDQRGMAHCKEPGNPEVRQALLETLTLCRAAGIEWQDIQHSTILGRDQRNGTGTP